MGQLHLGGRSSKSTDNPSAIVWTPSITSANCSHVSMTIGTLIMVRAASYFDAREIVLLLYRKSLNG